VGSRFPAYPTAMGRVLLAYLPQDQLDRYFATEKFERITEFTETNPDKIKRHLDKIRTDGYGVVQDELEVGLVSLAVPLQDNSGHVFAAMNCSSVARRTDGKEMLTTRLDLLREYAGQLTAALLRFPALAHSVHSDHNNGAQIAATRLKRLNQRRPLLRF
jgi:IclR family pca regulon transcriptional regulator